MGRQSGNLTCHRESPAIAKQWILKAKNGLGTGEETWGRVRGVSCTWGQAPRSKYVGKRPWC